MHALIELHEGLRRLDQLFNAWPSESEHWNEAQNRFQLIDRLLTECLGWDKVYMEVESNDDSAGRADYLLGKPARVVVEAKREALIWNLPPGGRYDRPRSLKSLTIACKNFNAAVLQVIPYCALRGIPVGIVTNGKQLAVFQATSIDGPPLDGQCFVFDGFKDYLSGFAFLWEILSPEGITENRALQKLSQLRSPKMPAKASTAIPEPYRYRYRSNLQESLRLIGSLLLEEIEDNPNTRREFYRECYVPLEANNRHLLLSKNIIQRRYKRSGDDAVSPAPLEAGTVGELVTSTTPAIGSRPVVVLGDVGVGKSSFFENLHLNMSQVGQEAIFISIDLGKNANLTASVREYVLSRVPEILSGSYGVDIFSKDFIAAAYHDQVKSFERRPEADLRTIDPLAYEKAKIAFLTELSSKPDKHLHASLAHIFHGQKRQIVLVMDNADQRTLAVQQEAFLIAQELAATRNLTVFVALRPSTFLTSKITGALSAYQNKILTISPPPVDEVIIKRLTFALRVAEGKAAPAALSGIRLNLNSIVLFLRSALRSIKSNDDIKQFLSNISGGNTRAVIELITGFCGSPNVDCKKIIDIESEKGDYKVPLHEFTKHALLGEYSYYNPQSSQLATNVFDISSADEREHFLLPLVVAFLSSNHGISDSDGFMFGEDVRREFVRLGFLDEQVTIALKRGARGKLIETPHSHYREIPVPEQVSPFSFQFRATSVGLYHIRFWCGSFPYLDAVSTDTPILLEADRKVVFEKAASFDIEDRTRKSSVFRSYLESAWNRSAFSVNYYDFRAVTQINSKDFDVLDRLLSKRALAKH